MGLLVRSGSSRGGLQLQIQSIYPDVPIPCIMAWGFSNQIPNIILTDLSWLSVQMSLKPCDSIRSSVFCLVVSTFHSRIKGLKGHLYKRLEEAPWLSHSHCLLVNGHQFLIIFLQSLNTFWSNLQLCSLCRHPPPSPYHLNYCSWVPLTCLFS